METNDLIYILIIGAVSGWLAGVIKDGYGFGLLGNIIIGIIGAFVGRWLLGSVLHVTFGGGTLGLILTSVVGALVVLFLVGLIRRS